MYSLESPNATPGLDLLAAVQHFFLLEPKCGSPQEQLPLFLLWLLLLPWTWMREEDGKDGAHGSFGCQEDDDQEMEALYESMRWP